MSIVLKFAVFQLLVFGPFISGAVLRKRFSRPAEFTRLLLRVNIIGVDPLIVFWSIWGLALSRDLLVLPVSGLGLVLAGLAAGAGAVRLLHTGGARRPTFIVSASLANHGFTMGGFICYLFLGERGLGLSVILLLFFIPYVYGFIFPYARAASRSSRPLILTASARQFVTDPQNMPLFAMAAAAVLNISGIRRPEGLHFPLQFLLMTSIGLYYFCLGISYSGIRIREYLREHIGLALIKFAVVPGCALSALQCMQLPADVRAVILIEACMPAAVFSVVTAVLFKLDESLASSLLVVNSLVFLGVVMPVVFLFQGALPAA